MNKLIAAAAIATSLLGMATAANAGPVEVQQRINTERCYNANLQRIRYNTPNAHWVEAAKAYQACKRKYNTYHSW